MIRARTGAALAFLGLAVFPMLGSALALLLDLPRRHVQFAFLVIFAVLLVGSLRVVLQPAGRRLQTRSLLWASIIAGVLTARMITGLALQDGPPAATAWAAGALALAWLVLLVYHLIVRFPGARNEGHESPRWFTYIVVAVIVTLAVIAYRKGPEAGEAYMAFGGSTIQMGTGSAILAGVALGALSGPWRVVALVAATYLVFVSTSRTGILLWIALCLLTIVARALRRSEGRSVPLSLGGHFLILAAGIALVILPVGHVQFYPYRSSRLGPEGAHIEFRDRRLTDAEAMYFRYRRLDRLFMGPSMDTDLPPGQVQRLEDEGAADSRWILLAKSVRVVAAHPWGSWPERFDRRTEIYCGRPPLCEYPHNLALEIGYHFGWPAMAAAVLGLIALGTRVLLLLGHPSVLPNVASTTLLGALGFTQVSGNLIDHSGALLLAAAWTLVRMGAADAGEGRSA